MSVAMPRRSLPAGGISIPQPCFFPSVSSIKTNLAPSQYIEVLLAAGVRQFLVSAYDISEDVRRGGRILDVLEMATSGGASVLLDSGNYESYWLRDAGWTVDRFHSVFQKATFQLAFCFDNQAPPLDVTAIADDV